MDDRQIGSAINAVKKEALRMRDAGEVREFVGLHGHVTLMLDRLQRWFKLTDKLQRDAEIVGLAADGLIALGMSLPPCTVDVDELLVAHDAERESDWQRIRELTGDDETTTEADPLPEGREAGVLRRRSGGHPEGDPAGDRLDPYPE